MLLGWNAGRPGRGCRQCGVHPVSKYFFVAAGTLCMALGAIGVFVPILPTTPFLLLAAGCYLRGSRRCYRWLTTNRWCGEYIRNYQEGRGISRRQKTILVLLLWGAIGGSVAFAVSAAWIRWLLLAIAAAVTAHLLRLPTFRPGVEDGGAAAPRT
ncbi:MAG: YbaN family protein [Kiritimatiellae bacterium]|nr:YbaN family protein [Kiritimatiellia bacterium]